MARHSVTLVVSFPISERKAGGRDSRSDKPVWIGMLPQMLLECEKLLRSQPDGVGLEGGEFKLLNAKIRDGKIDFIVELSA